ncbi:MAG: DUF503 domain-containing protein [Dehalococcoidia bacterium]|nr:DUF503 domain-containing protein [Dehalococcoidia bacterium]
MNVGVCQIELRLQGNRSLKGKRGILKPIIAQVKNHYEVSIAEVDHLNQWQMATLGLACVSNDARHANEVLSKAVNFIANSRFEIEILDYSIEIIPFP